MAQIREELILSDKFSGGFRIYINLAEKAAKSTTQAQVAASKLAEASTRSSNVFVRTAQSIRSATLSLREYLTSSKSAKSATDSLTSGVRRLAAQLLGLQAVKGLAGLADNLTSINARLDMMNDGLQTTDKLNKMIMDSANRTGGSYQETADLVGKLGVLAGDAFGSSAETVAFAEQVNKLMAISGTSAEGASAAMLQLTQAMSSGVLRGEELNSVLEQAPTIAQTIAEYLGVNTGELRNMASEGKVTAEVVKNALLSTADETNAKFEQMPMTFSRIGNRAANAFIGAFQPAVQRFNEWLNSDTGQRLVSGIERAAEIIGNVVGVIVDTLTSVTDFLSSNWDTVMAAAGVAAAIFAGYLMAMTVSAIAANLPLIALIGTVTLIGMVLSNLGISGTQVLGALGGAFGALGAIAYNAFAIIYNAVAAVADFISNVFRNPVAAVAQLFINLADTVLSVLSSIAGAVDFVFGTVLQSGVEGFRSKLTGWAEDYFNDTNANLKNTKRLDLKNIAESAASTADLFAGIGGSFGDAGGTNTWTNTLNDISANTASTAGSAGSIEKSLGLAEEDLKSLVDVAEQRYVNRINLTAQTPVINITGANTGNTPADRQRLADMIRDTLVEQWSSGGNMYTNYAITNA